MRRRTTRDNSTVRGRLLAKSVPYTIMLGKCNSVYLVSCLYLLEMFILANSFNRSLTRPEDFSTERTDTNAAFQDCKATDVIPNYDSYACGKGATFPVPNSYIGWANVDPPKQSMHDLIKDGRFGICQDNVVNSDAGLKQ